MQRDSLNSLYVKKFLENALFEDLGVLGDITSQAIFSKEEGTQAIIVSKSSGVLSGIGFAGEVFKILDPEVTLNYKKKDGDWIVPEDVLLEIDGNIRTVLSGERIALNLSSRLSGIATLVAEAVKLVEGLGIQLVCTRKTTPNLRAFEKYAVGCGGGYNHRFGLYDAVMIKDNHIAARGSLSACVERVKKVVGPLVKIEVECDTLEQVHEALKSKVDIVLCDNMALEDVKEAAKLCKRARILIECSGGVTLENLRNYGATGVDFISLGCFTHSISSLNFSLDIVT